MDPTILQTVGTVFLYVVGAGLAITGIAAIFKLATGSIGDRIRARRKRQADEQAEAEKPSTLKMLETCDKNDLFPVELKVLIQTYQSVVERREFVESFGADSEFMRVYDLIEAQVESDMKSASQFIRAYHPFANPSKEYLYQLMRNSRELSKKLSELVEELIKHESLKDDVDTSYVYDYIDAIGELRQASGK